MTATDKPNDTRPGQRVRSVIHGPGTVLKPTSHCSLEVRRVRFDSGKTFRISAAHLTPIPEDDAPRKDRILLRTNKTSIVPTFLHDDISENDGDVIIDIITYCDDDLPEVSVRWGTPS